MDTHENNYGKDFSGVRILDISLFIYILVTRYSISVKVVSAVFVPIFHVAE